MINITKTVSESEIYLYGYVGQHQEIDWQPFQKAFRELSLTNKEITIRINCMGGDTFSGLAIYDLIRNSKVKVTGINEGVAASMGAILLLACDVRKATKNSRVMVHSVSGFVGGNAQDVEQYAKLMMNEDSKLLDILMGRTGLDETTCRNWINYGHDTWFNSSEALALGLIHEIIQSDKGEFNNETSLLDAIANNSLESIWNYYQDSNKNPLNSIRKPFKLQLIEVINRHTCCLLEPTDQDQDFITAISNIINGQDATIRSLENTLEHLTVLNQRLGWTFDDWALKDSKGLEQLQETKHPLFDRLVNHKVAIVRASGIIGDC